MEMTASRISRYLPFLAGLLLIESVVGFLPLLKEYANSPFGAIAYFGGLGLMGTLSLSAVTLSCRPPDVRTPIALVFLGAATSFVPILLPPDGTWVFNSDQFFSLFSQTGLVLEIAGAPLLWGSALVRREQPAEPEPLRISRIGAGLILFGFVISAVFNATRIVRASSLSFGLLLRSSSALDVLGGLIDLVSLLILLWASIEGVRTVSGPAGATIAAQRIHHLMKVWLLLRAATSVLNLISWQLEADESEKVHYLVQQSWQLVVLVTLVLTMVVLVTRRFPGLGDGCKARLVKQ